MVRRRGRVRRVGYRCELMMRWGVVERGVLLRLVMMHDVKHVIDGLGCLDGRSG